MRIRPSGCSRKASCRTMSIPSNSKLEDPEERSRMANVFERGLTKPSGYVLPVQRWNRPGLGTALALGKVEDAARPAVPGAGRFPGRLPPAARHAALCAAGAVPLYRAGRSVGAARAAAGARGDPADSAPAEVEGADEMARRQQAVSFTAAKPVSRTGSSRRSPRSAARCAPRSRSSRATGGSASSCRRSRRSRTISNSSPPPRARPKAIGLPVHIEGYGPPHDPRLNVIRVAPDPGVIEVNIHPASNWQDCVATTTAIYEEARQTRLGADKFMIDGRHTGTGGGNHVVVGGATPNRQPVPAPARSVEEPGAAMAAASVAVLLRSPACSSARPARRRASTRRATTASTSSRSPWRRCRIPEKARRRCRGWSTGCSATC